MSVPDHEIVKMFQRYLASSDPSEIDNLDAQELTAAEARLSIRGTNPTFTAVMKVQIAKLELKENRRYESKIRAWNLLTGLLLGLVIAGASAWAFGT
jgi:hypothetical protein